jgi:hypothetical protein
VIKEHEGKGSKYIIRENKLPKVIAMLWAAFLVGLKRKCIIQCSRKCENHAKIFVFTKIFAKISRKSHENFHEKSIKFSHFKNFCENFFTKIEANKGIIIDVEYLGNGASD